MALRDHLLCLLRHTFVWRPKDHSQGAYIPINILLNSHHALPFFIKIEDIRELKKVRKEEHIIILVLISKIYALLRKNSQEYLITR